MSLTEKPPPPSPGTRCFAHTLHTCMTPAHIRTRRHKPNSRIPAREPRARTSELYAQNHLSRRLYTVVANNNIPQCTQRTHSNILCCPTYRMYEYSPAFATAAAAATRQARSGFPTAAHCARQPVRPYLTERVCAFEPSRASTGLGVLSVFCLTGHNFGLKHLFYLIQITQCVNVYKIRNFSL